jgi:predicted phosphodiesterase
VRHFIWTNDLHFDRMLPRHREKFVQWVRECGADALVLAGDIGEADSVCAYLRELHDGLEQPIYFVLGNHDFYHGEFDTVRSAVRDLVHGCPRLHWLSERSIIPLDESTALIGHEGWGDGRWGDYERSGLFIYDFERIKDLMGFSREERLRILNRLGDEAAAYLRGILQEALAAYSHVYLVTHVPPFREACGEGALHGAMDHKLPFYICKAVGDLLLEVMERHPERRLTVLCGHTHRKCDVQVLGNLRVMAREAGYGSWYTPSVIEIRHPQEVS